MKTAFFRFLGWYLLLLIGIAACGASGVFDDSTGIDLRSMPDATWVLEEYGPENALTPALPESLVTLVFDFDSKWASGGAGCNHYTARFNIKGLRLSFDEAMATLMACSPEAIMEQETAYLELLSQVVSYQTDGEALTLYTQEGDVLKFEAIK